MSTTQVRTATATYTYVDIENVVRRVNTDLVMIADSTGCWTAEEARSYAHDIEVLAKAGYLAWVDVMLISNGVEVKAVRFEVDTDAGSLTTSRPGGVLWPKIAGATLRIILNYSDAYTLEKLLGHDHIGVDVGGRHRRRNSCNNRERLHFKVLPCRFGDRSSGH